MKTETEQLIRAAIALQAAALEWGGDDSPTQAEARQALLAFPEILNTIHKSVATMKVKTDQIRRKRS